MESKRLAIQKKIKDAQERVRLAKKVRTNWTKDKVNGTMEKLKEVKEDVANNTNISKDKLNSEKKLSKRESRCFTPPKSTNDFNKNYNLKQV